MPQIAQQDYIRIPVANVAFNKITSEEKAQILKHLDNWPDILVEDADGNEIRFLSCDKKTKTICYYDPRNEEIETLELE